MTTIPKTLAPQTLSQLDPTLPPAVALPLTGRHLIEASAGTGKTWTLTGVVLRLLIEAGQPCDKIIATTFTKSAAAEMRQRIRERLQTFNRLLRLITQNSFAKAIDPTAEIDEQQVQFWQWLSNQVAEMKDKKLAESLEDPINEYLLKLIARQTFLASHFLQDSESQPIPSKSMTAKPTLNFRIASQRTETALNQLDRLFVSTLDSLCQKWLREFSSDTGYSTDVEISNDVKPIVLAMIHDQLRAFWANIESQSPELYRLMSAQGQLFEAKDFYKAVDKALSFYTADIDVVSISPIDFNAIRNLMGKIADTQDETFDLYLDKQYRADKKFRSNASINTKFYLWHELKNVIATRDVEKLLNLEKSNQALFALFRSFYELFEMDKGISNEQERETFKSIELVKEIDELYRLTLAIEEHFKNLNAFFTQFISRYVRQQLPKLLEAQRLTTFSLQLARLNQALQGRQGEALARYIRHQYPIALIDESQDVNTEQALLIQRIYLDKALDKTDTTQPKSYNKRQQDIFLLLVGDPKQAIYGFRGGDVYNYTTLKKQFDSKPIALLHNRRSSKALIDSLNQWYGVAQMSDAQSESIEQTLNPSDPYFMGEAIFYRKIAATRENAELLPTKSDSEVPALFYLNVPYQYPLPQAEQPQTTTNKAQHDESYVTTADAIAAQILALLDNTHDNPLLLKEQQLSINDFCVLARNNKELTEVEKALHSQGIPTLRNGNHSVFADVMSADLQVLMSAMLNPYHQGKLKTLLMTQFFRLSLIQANTVLAQEEGGNRKDPLATQISDMLVRAGELWQKEEFLVAIQWLLTQTLKMPEQTYQTFWQRLASDNNGERLLIDLRQLLDILADVFAVQKTGVGEYQLFDWYCEQRQRCPTDDWALQQRLPSEQGVQLMTIHRSKGLEFAIVFVVGLDNGLSKKTDKHTLYLYGDDDNLAKKPMHNPLLTRRLSAIASDNTLDYQAIQTTSEIYESLRLMYVALTRARERLYIVTEAQKPVKDSKAEVTTPLKNFISDNKSFSLNEQAEKAVTMVDINSLSKYLTKNCDLRNIQTTTEADQTQPIGYNSHYQAIKKLAFIGWSNTSFTALSRFVSHDRHDMAVHEPDFDGFDEDVNVFDIEQTDFNLLQTDAENLAKKSSIKGLWDLMITDNQNSLSNNEYFKQTILPTQQDEHSYNFDNQQDIAPDWHGDKNIGGDIIQDWEMLNADLSYFDDLPTFETGFDDDYYIAEQAGEGSYHDDYGQYEQGDINYGEDFAPVIAIEPNPASIGEESKLLRFNFEKGVSAGTFLHKVLEDLANNHYEQQEDSVQQTIFNGDSCQWLPPKRWAVMIDRALRSQQLPSQYYSSEATAQNILVKFAEMSDDVYRQQLQPTYLALTQWLNEVIHSPFLATGQRPIDIRHHQKSAEMGFNMRLKGELSLKKLNDLFAEQGIALNLQENHSHNSYWQYLRGEIDLVYQHNQQFYVIDYKSNFLGNTFAHYQADNLVQAMDEHRYWLQASIYQVALHRFLQLRLPDYDMATHLGAVEYAFIRGMSPQHRTGRLVWQPNNDFILALDQLFG